MIRHVLGSLGLLFCLLPCAASADDGALAALRIKALASPVSVRLRGLSAVSDDIAWASGQGGTVLRSTDAGKSWAVMHVPGAASLDLRDVHGFSAETAVVMGAGPGDASRVFRTSDGGARWIEVLRNPDPAGFFDCIDFDGERGVLLGDPVGGRFRIFRSRDGGRSWAAGIGPEAVDGEAAFAASGTCVLLAGGGTLVATGGFRARVHYLPQRLESKGDWQAIDAEFPKPAASAGLFSLARRGPTAVAVGGDFRRPAAPAIIVTVRAPETPAGRDNVRLRSWPKFSGTPPGYRSGLACERRNAPVCIATGPDASDLLRASGAGLSRWTPLPGDGHGSTGYDSVANAGGVFWFSGEGGRIGRLVLPTAPERVRPPNRR